MCRTDFPNPPSFPCVLQIWHHHSTKTQMTTWCYFKHLNINDKWNTSKDVADIYKRCFYIIFYFFWPKMDYVIFPVYYKPLHFYPHTSPSLDPVNCIYADYPPQGANTSCEDTQNTEKQPITFDSMFQILLSHIWKKSKHQFASVSFLPLSLGKCSSFTILPYWVFSLSGYTGKSLVIFHILGKLYTHRYIIILDKYVTA